MYEDGEGVPKDPARAVKWLQKSADQRYPCAENSLGVAYEQGDGIEQDYASAEDGLALGQYNYGRMYEAGHGVAKSVAEAIRWYRKAASQGDADAKERLKVLRLAEVIEAGGLPW